MKWRLAVNSSSSTAVATPRPAVMWFSEAVVTSFGLSVRTTSVRVCNGVDLP